ncbi:hypothetical protein DdX_12070 [Ditylenchus destructor]|uniref:Uncharacterized protein n=1 Tax=Ditylenchus destructor TaxID=166010 RepID=A0AAD4MV76_9BILA|nr:hypothetical protein DdX_12070 [Ditylenchus destructor]
MYRPSAIAVYGNFGGRCEGPSLFVVYSLCGQPRRQPSAVQTGQQLNGAVGHQTAWRGWDSGTGSPVKKL